MSFQDDYLKTKFENLIEYPCASGCCERGVQSQDNQEDRRWEDSIGGGSYATGKESRTDKKYFYTQIHKHKHNKHKHTTLVISLSFPQIKVADVPGVIKILDWFESAESFFIVMEKFAGQVNSDLKISLSMEVLN